MGKVITVFSHKGGVGKTTLVHNLGFLMANTGKKVLLVDADAQMNLTASVFGFSTQTKYTETSAIWRDFLGANTNFALYLKNAATGGLQKNAFYKKSEIYNYRQPHRKTKYRSEINSGDSLHFKNNGVLELLPSSIGYNPNDIRGDASLSTLPKIEFQLAMLVSNPEGFGAGIILKLSEAINTLSEQYDYVLIDTSPSASSILNGLILLSSDYFLVPAKPDFFSSQAIDNLTDVFNNWAKLFSHWMQTPNQKGLLYPKFLGIVPQMTKRFSIDTDEDSVGFAEHAKEWNAHINASITLFLKSYSEHYQNYQLGQSLDSEVGWFKTIYPDSEPFIIKECVHFTGKLRTLAEKAAIPVAFLNNAIGQEMGFPVSIFDNPHDGDQYALAFQAICEEYSYIANGLMRL